jgi:hypothetical protein
MTELTSIYDVEFEKRMLLSRIARQVGDLGNKRLRHRTTRLFGNVLQVVLFKIFRTGAHGSFGGIVARAWAAIQ